MNAQVKTRMEETTMLTRRHYLGITILTASAGKAHAAWPDRPVRLIVPFPPGSGTDVLARFIAEPFAKKLGQPVVIDNRPGGNGVVGAQAGASAAANGLTLTMLGTSAAAINPHMIRRLPYDPLKDFTPIGGVAHQPLSLIHI